MIAVDPNSRCEQAKAYYYEYLSGEPRGCTPTEMFAHIDKCRFCQAEVKRLKVIMVKGEEHAFKGAGQTTAVITTSLRFHFAYLGAFVGCNTVKLFLPSLATPATEVAVPTPITVHLDKCQQCTSDLEAIRQLNLTHKQLFRLGQLFAEESRVDANICAKAKNAIASLGAMVFEVQHLCVCPECRKLVYENRKRRCGRLPQNLERSPMPCDTVSDTEIFDYVVPYGIDPGRNGYAVVHKSLTSHLVNCPRCLDRMRKLHDTVYGILERHESGIVTCYRVCDSDRDSIVASADDMYEDWPIQVKVFDRSSETDRIEAEGSSVEVSRKPERTPLMTKIRPFIKPAAVAAAVILVALLLLNAPVAKAVDLAQMSKALERIKNVYITTFYQEESNKTQEVWISRTLNIKILKTGTECVLWDIKAKSSKLKNLNTGSIAVAELDSDVLVRVKETMEGPLGLLPSNSIKGAKWLPVPNENIESTIPGTQVYDLTWTGTKPDGSIVVYNKWRGYIDIEKKLPRKIEWWEKKHAEDEYGLLTIIKLSYPTAAEIQAAIREVGF
jgi:hypothetical protein